eukprot:6194447-Pleurochrysis_carterae.AAC.2
MSTNVRAPIGAAFSPSFRQARSGSIALSRQQRRSARMCLCAYVCVRVPGRSPYPPSAPSAPCMWCASARAGGTCSPCGTTAGRPCRYAPAQTQTQRTCSTAGEPRLAIVCGRDLRPIANECARVVAVDAVDVAWAERAACPLLAQPVHLQ